MSVINLSFHDWLYPTKRKRVDAAACNGAGMFAYAVGKTLAIYEEYERTHFPIICWSPFSCDITAIAWSDGSAVPVVMEMYLAVASKHGVTSVFDIKEKTAIAHFDHRGQRVNVIKWSAFFPEIFYMGFENGNLAVCKLFDGKMDTMNVGFPIDFIDCDAETGRRMLAGSKTGKMSLIYLTSHGSIQGKTETVDVGDSSVDIKFFPNNADFAICTGASSACLFSLHEKVSIPFLDSSEIRFLKPFGNKCVVIGYDNGVECWSYNTGVWMKQQILPLSTQKPCQREVQIYCSGYDSIYAITESQWLTQIKSINGRLFITERTKMMPSKPLDWDFWNGSIAFCMKDGSLLTTQETPNSAFDIYISEDLSLSTNSASSKHRKRRRSENDEISSRVPAQTLSTACGNSCEFVTSIKICKEPLDHVSWISRDRIILWKSNALYIVSLKNRRVSEPLKNQIASLAMPITDVILSDDRETMSVILGNTLCMFMTTDEVPVSLGRISFNTSVVGTAAPNKQEYAFIGDNDMILVRRRDGDGGLVVYKNFKLDFDAKSDAAACIVWAIGGIIIGTQNGNIIHFDLMKMALSVIDKVAGGIKRMFEFGRKSMIIMKRDNTALVYTKGAFKSINGIVENMRIASSKTILISIKGNGSLMTVNPLKRSQRLLPCVTKSPVLHPAPLYMSLLASRKMDTPEEFRETCYCFGMPFACHLFDVYLNSSAFEENNSLLLSFISHSEELTGCYARLALYNGDKEFAHRILVSTKPSDPNYIMNVMKAALFGYSVKGRHVDGTIAALMNTGKGVDASDIELIVNDTEAGISVLLAFGHYKEAAMILRAQHVENQDLILRTARVLMLNGYSFLGYLVLAQKGMRIPILAELEQSVEPELMQMLLSQ